MVSDKELAAIIARSIFECGDGVTRIELKRGDGTMNTKKETSEGGFGEGPLADHIESILNVHRSY